MTVAYVLVGVLLGGGLLLGAGMLAGVWFGVSSMRPELLERRRKGR